MHKDRPFIRRIPIWPWLTLALLGCSAGSAKAKNARRPKIDVNVKFDLTKATPLCELMRSFGSDKGQPSGSRKQWHDYTKYYHAIFAPVRNEPLRIFEMGIGTTDTAIPSNMGAEGKPGASLRGWKAYFPKAMVFGADIDKKVLFREDRIETFFCDMTKPDVIATMWKEPLLSDPLDIIIDDGLHVFEAQVTLLENSLHKLASGGVYVVEDVNGEDIPRFENMVRAWKKRFAALDLSYGFVRLPNRVNDVDNNLLVLQRNR